MFRMKDVLENDKHLVTLILVVLLAVWVFTRDDKVTRMIDTVLGALITLVTQKLVRKDR